MNRRTNPSNFNSFRAMLIEWKIENPSRFLRSQIWSNVHKVLTQGVNMSLVVGI